MPLTELQQQSAETETNPMAYPEMESDGQASTQFTARGPKPPPSGEFNDAPAKSPSDQAFEDAEPDPHHAAKQYNNAHPDHVSKFNDLTGDKCMVDGQLDIGLVIEFQSQHGLTPDGMIGPHTVGAAKHVAKTVGTPSAEGSAMASELFREVNGDPVATSAPAPKTVGTPSPEGRAMADELFREVNGGPGQASPTTPSGAPVSEAEAPSAPIAETEQDQNQRRRA